METVSSGRRQETLEYESSPSWPPVFLYDPVDIRHEPFFSPLLDHVYDPGSNQHSAKSTGYDDK